MKLRKTLALICVFILALSGISAMAEETATAPKYVFMFIGDGMGNPQVAATQYYLGTLQNPDSEVPVPADLSFTNFPYLGMVTTYDSSSFCPASASTATSMASGEKTLSGVINYDETLTTPFKLITEYAKESGKKIGVISSVSVDHATPAAYYAKQPSRNDYYDIALQAVTGDTVDYLAGGGFKKPDGDGSQDNLLDLAAENGWTITTTTEEVRALNAESGRVLATNPVLQDSASILYEIDRIQKAEAGEDVLSLADFVRSGINVLDNENGFFMMCEGGKIDWAGHANDAATSIYDTIALSDAVQVAIDFAAEHPDETLIIVTADHETGGMTIGFATTGYDTHFDYLANQKTSFTNFDETIAEMKENGTSFEDALKAVEEYYGLTTKADQPLSLTEAEIESLRTAYEWATVKDTSEMGEEEALLYGGYNPFSMAISHIINNKAGLSYTSYAHTGLQIPVYAMGVGAEKLSGLYDNTDIFDRTMEIMDLTAE